MPDSGNVNFNGDITGDWNVHTGSGAQHIQVNKGQYAANLEHVDELVARLLAGLASLSPGDAATAAGEAVAVKNEAHAARPDQDRLRQSLSRLATATGPVPEMSALSGQLADGVGRLMR